MKYYIIAGEQSGDLHGANLIQALRRADSKAEFRCWGGDKMSAAGGHVVKHIKDLAFMGFMEVVKHLPTILGNISWCKKDISVYNPDAVILIDYPGFNFRLFEFIKEKGYKLYYYISPQLWAWKTGRVKKVKAYVDKMFVIFPFEKDFYAKHGVDVDFVGHPLLDELKDSVPTNDKKDEPVIALLPGSRKQEILKLLPEYIKVIRRYPSHKFIVAGLSGLGHEFYSEIIGDSRCEIVWDQTYALLDRAEAAIVTSGTATLETALHNVPEVICYKASALSYMIAKRLIKGIEYICIVNLIADKPIVKELIQDDVNEENLTVELGKLLDAGYRSAILNGYDEVRQLLGSEGASDRTAALIVKYMSANA